MAKQQNFTPIFIGKAEFANDTSFVIEQTAAKGTCRITDKNGDVSYARSIVNAWANVRYQGRVNHKTQHSDGVVWARDL